MTTESNPAKSKRRRQNAPNTRRLTVHLPADLYTQLRKTCVDQDWSFSYGVERAIQGMLRAHKKRRQRAKVGDSESG